MNIKTASIKEHYPYWDYKRNQAMIMPVTYWHYLDFDKKRPKEEFICLN